MSDLQGKNGLSGKALSVAAAEKTTQKQNINLLWEPEPFNQQNVKMQHVLWALLLQISFLFSNKLEKEIVIFKINYLVKIPSRKKTNIA